MIIDVEAKGSESLNKRKAPAEYEGKTDKKPRVTEEEEEGSGKQQTKMTAYSTKLNLHHKPGKYPFKYISCHKSLLFL